MTQGVAPQPGTPREKNFERLSQRSARIPFRAKLAVVWLAIAGTLTWLFLTAGFDIPWIRDHAQFVFKGLRYTIILAVGAIILACIMAVVGALCRLSPNPVLYGISGFYTSFFRGTPLIVQLFLIYLALPQLAQGFDNPRLEDLLTLDPFQAGIIGLGLNYGAYMTEIFRAGIQSVDGGQWEAAEALAMTYPQRMRRVILPQAIRVIIPPTGNEFIAMMKDTALVSFLGVTVSQAEIFRRAQLVGKEDFKQLEAFLMAAAIYWALTGVFTFFQSRLERKLARGYSRTPSTATTTPAKVVHSSGGPELPGQGH